MNLNKPSQTYTKKVDGDGEIVTVQLTLTRVILEDGQMAVRVETPNRYNAVEVLGLLEIAKLQVYREINRTQ